MKESEAKTKWRPFVRLSIVGDMSFDNRGNDYHNPDCLGSDCMMWIQWDNEYMPSQPGEKAESYPAGTCGLKRI